MADGNSWTYIILIVYNKVIKSSQLWERLLWFQNFTCNPARNYRKSFTLVWQPQDNKITLKSSKLLTTM